jgi:MurNAc alpha-1-phosphate uridylyltransferase
VPNPPHNARGDFALEGERVLSDGPERLTFAAIGLYRPDLFAGLSPDQPAKLAPLLRLEMHAGRVTGELHAGEWHDIGTPDRLAALDRRLRKS